ncbi:MAG: COX15/CtaA family protein [Bacteroidetes bacterium]|nr:COX15/CtaA family protein [Bacteroidota bacterium]MDE2670946.1 COX15/CtaA family protein [Bacteroidota bacterium]
MNSLDITSNPRWRYRYAAGGLLLCLLLVSWGGVVTSIEAGLAVPDWPSSFGSYDPIATGYSDPENPDARWWHEGPVLAEHGHRLLGALVGLWIVGLALWTWLADSRGWVRILAVSATGLVILQGVLGGLRVIWTSMDLAVVHAMGAQLFFCAAVILTVSCSRTWHTHNIESSPETRQLRILAGSTAVAVYIQILLGALLRHPGAGVDLTFVIVHAAGSVLVLSLIIITCGRIREHYSDKPLLNRGAWVMLTCLILQLILGMIALTTLLYDAGQGQRSLAQVVFSSSHLVVGTILMGSCACVLLGTLRLRSG